MIGVALLFLALGLFFLAKPEIVWELQHFLTVKNGEPTDFALRQLRIGGIVYLVISGTLIVLRILNIT